MPTTNSRSPRDIASDITRNALIPPPMYEMPNNVFFELTGVLQVIPAALIVKHLFRMVRVNRPARAGYAAGD